MAWIELNTRPSEKQVRTFGAIGMPLLLAGAALIAWLRFDSFTVAACLAISALLIEVTTWLVPSIVRSLMIGFNVVFFPLAWMMSHLAMAFFFFGMLTPLAWVVRVTRGDPLERNRDEQRQSYWIPRSTPSVDRYFRQY